MPSSIIQPILKSSLAILIALILWSAWSILPAYAQEPVGETGAITLTDTIDGGTVVTVTTVNTYTDPVVVAFINTRNEDESVDVRVRNVTPNSFQIFMQEPDNQTHSAEQVSYIVLEKGRHTLVGGLVVEAGAIITAAVHQAPDAFGGEVVTFSSSFVITPAVLYTLNSYNNNDFMSSVAHSVITTGFSLQQEMAEVTTTVTAIETIAWIALETGSGTTNGAAYEIGQASDGANDGVGQTAQTITFSSFSSVPDVVVKGNSGNGVDGYWARGAGSYNSISQTVYAEEDQVGDPERNHADETFAWAAFDPDSILVVPQFSLDSAASAVLTDVQKSSVAWGDYDNDGDLDILLTGNDGSNPIAGVYENTGSGFSEISAGLPGVDDSSVAWGDYDNDGDLDILLTGLTSSGSIAGIYENTDSGFSDISAVLTDVQRSSAAWGDYDNDGDLDILLTGLSSGGRIAQVYENTGSGFSDISAGLPGVEYSSAAWGDYDNDGDLDILLTGYTGTNRIASVYQNTGNGFSDISAGLPGVNFSSVAWGDYDNDGDLDILLTGYTDTNHIASVYQNTGSGFSDIGASLTGIRLGSAAWGDYDNDGDLDILLTGQTGSSSRTARVYENTGSGGFSDISAGLTGVEYSSAAWGDYDNDGDLDILLTGCTNGSCTNRTSRVYENNNIQANTPPAAPTGLSSSVSGYRIELSWAAVTDTQTISNAGLTYNLYVGRSPGLSDTLAPMACVGACGSSSDGYRQIPALGAANHGLTATLTISQSGAYYWSVQAIDTAFVGSPWAAEGTFEIRANLAINKTVNPASAAPGETITYTLSFSNSGDATASGVVITDFLPISITVQSVISSGDVAITRTLSNQSAEVFETSALSSGAGGLITITAQLSSSVRAGTLTNTATITATAVDMDTTNNTAAVGVTIPQFSLDSAASAGLPDVGNGSVAWGDYDNDGDLDILLTGNSSSGRIARVYENTGSGFTVAHTLTDVKFSSVAWGDYDNDGDLDILLTGFASSGYIASVYENTGSGFTNISASVSLKGVWKGSVAWGDYDNDGDLDILLTGCEADSCTSRIARVYENTGSGFSLAHSLTGVSESSVAWGDYDNDGDLDILLTGCEADSCTSRITRVYKNTDGVFTDISVGLPNVQASSVAWGDYDNDGDLDILLSGEAGSGLIAQVYQNTDIGFTVAHTMTGVSESSVAWGDYDNDGDLDILLTGCEAGSCSSLIARVYENTGGGGFSDIGAGLTGVYRSSAAWGDYDNDGDLDILLTGCLVGNCSSRTTEVYENNNSLANSRPAAPTGLNASVNGTTVELSWLAAADTETISPTLTYNLYIGSSPGLSDTLSPMAFTSGVSEGLRLLPALGSAQHGLTATLTISQSGIYYWSVQAIDTAWAGSPWAAEGTFEIRADLAINKSVNPASAQPGETITYTLSFSNSSGTASGVVITDFLPISVTVQNVISSGDVVITRTLSNQSAEVFETSALSSGAGGLITITAQLSDTLSNGELFTNTATITSTAMDANTSNNSAAVGVTAVVLLDLSLSKTVNPASAALGETITYTLSFTNNGPGIAVGVVITDFLPISITVQSVISSGDVAIIRTLSNQTAEVFETSAVSSGAGGLITITAQLSSSVSAGTLTNTATITSTAMDTNTSNNSAAVGLTVLPDLSLAKTVNPASAQPGETITYTLSFTNNGPDTASGVVITDFLPISITVQSVISSGDVVITRTLSNQSAEVFETSALSSGAGGLITITAQLSSSVSAGTLTNTATITSTAVDTDMTNNTAAVGVTFPQFSLDSAASAVLTDVRYSSAAWGDYDNDGDLDILLIGWTGSSNPIAQIYENTGSGFSNINAGLTNVSRGSAVWGDYDNDGDLDILLTGQDSSSNSIAQIYENTGSGFSDISAGLPGVYRNSTAWGDYDNDGDLDILLVGCTNSSCTSRITSVYENTGSGFSDINAGLPGRYRGTATWGDHDNDGDLDIFLMGCANNTCNNRNTRVYQNTAGIFSDIGAGLPHLADNSMAWGDYDNDGDLDILLTGCTTACISSPPIAQVYKNTDSVFSNISAGLPGVWRSSVAWGDYDNDGDLDILLTGCTTETCSSRTTRVYKNTDGVFTDISADLPGVTDGSVAWGDYDNDGDLDILLTGWTGSSHIAEVYQNNNGQTNTPPATPTGLSSSINGTWIALSWAAVTDTQTISNAGLTYNLRVGTSPGLSDTLAPMACIGPCGSSSDGYRQIPALGAANHGLTATLIITQQGTYYWSVQAIDTAFAGSSWAVEESFKIGADLAINKTVNPASAAPGETITYTLTFTNNGPGIADNVVITDTLPVSITVQSVISSGDVVITETQSGSVFETEPLSIGQGGVITITAILSNPLAAGPVGNTAIITSTTVDSDTANNDASAGLTVNNVAPVLDPIGDQGIIKSRPLNLTLSATDANGGALTYNMSGTPVSGGATLVGSLFSWTPGVTGTYQITFTVIDDGSPVLTDSETITITVYDGPGVTIAQSGGATDVAEGSITDTYQVVLNSPPTSTVTVTVTSDSQINTLPVSLTFTTLDWDRPQTVTVTAIDDVIYEGNHTGAIIHTAASADTNYNGLGINGVTVNIDDDSEDIPTITISDLSIAESAGTANISVTLTGQSLFTAGVRYNVTNGTALGGGVDYSAGNGSLIWTAGTSGSQSIAVIINDDTLDEVDETVNISLGNVVSATLVKLSAVLTITDNDAAPSLSIAKTVEFSSVPPTPGDPITYTIVISNSGGGAENVTVADNLPNGLSGDNLDWTGTVTAYKSLTFTLNATILNIAANYTATITNTVTFTYGLDTDQAVAAFTTISDTIAPTGLTLISPTHGSVITASQRITFSWSAAGDGLSGVDHYTLQVETDNDSLDIQANDTVTTTQTSHTPAADLANGVYTWTVWVQDLVGNVSSGVSATFVISATGSSGTSVYLPIVVKN